MQAHEIDVFIPEDHQLTVAVPASIQSGPARLILLVPSVASADRAPEQSSSVRQASPEIPALARAQAYVRSLVPEGSDLVGELLADRRAEARGEQA